MPGIPFYSVGFRCVHSTVWVQPIYRVSLAVKFPDGTNHDLGTKTFGLQTYQTSVEQFLFGASLPVGSQQEEQNLEQRWGRLRADPDPYAIDEDTIGQSKQVYLYSNSITPERYVDTSTVLFLNTSKPLAGSAEATATLNSDGTLGSGSSKEESKTIATFTGLLPTSELTKSLPQLFALGAPENYTVQIVTKTEFYKHAHSAPAAGTPPCGVPAGTKDIVTSNANIKVEHVSDVTPAPSEAPKTESPKKPTS